jgi:two-component system response regulator HydG
MTATANPDAVQNSRSPVLVLVVDDEQHVLDTCAAVAESCGLQALTASTTGRALELLEHRPVDIVLTDLKVPEAGGLELLKLVRASYPQVAVIILTQYGTVDTAVEAMRLGASDYLTKPFHIEELKNKLSLLARGIELDRENRVLRGQLSSNPGFGGLIGVSTKMQRVYKVIEKTSPHSYPVLILGESGTGKELVARSIHFGGPRRTRPFVPVDCSALAPTLIESELFGHVKGAFTGAVQSRPGLMEAAHGGTLFLDEIGDLPVDLQAKLLRAIQEKEIRPVGSTERVPTNARIISATNRDLDAAIRGGTFRQDLFFRLNVVQLKLPPLRDRKSDIPLLVNHFLEKFSEPHRSVRSVSPEAMARLMAYEWPGNVRELENAIERALALGSGPILHVGDLPSNLHYGPLPGGPATDDLLPLEEMEKRAIFRAIRETGGDKLAAARLLGIGKTTLYRKLKSYEESHKGE